MYRLLEIFTIALRLGFIAFGGPAAHIGYFKETYVNRRKWISDQRFAELLAVSQFLPGPGSSQLGAAIGYHRGGWMGAFLAWFGFTVPSAVMMIVFAKGIDLLHQNELSCLHCLVLVALAVVANAIITMQKNLCDCAKTRGLAVFALVFLLFSPIPWSQPLVILLGGIIGIFIFKPDNSCKLDIELPDDSPSGKNSAVTKKQRLLLYGLGSVGIVTIIPFLLKGSEDLETTAGIFKAGSLVFGGGHVVLPLLGTEVVDTGKMDSMAFLAGYGTTQAMPGPVFTFAGYIGSKLSLFGSSWLGGTIALIAIFLPGMLLMAGFVPIWDSVKRFSWAHDFIKGTNAAVVGLLAHAWYVMLLQANMNDWWEWIIILVSLVILYKKLLPVWLLVVLSSVVGYFIYRF
ncbi:chromate efflux transporter [Akkermansiaceae bacterium]|nr:chromate efflux transporter [Akkermansiaceae bacterium]